MDILHCPFCGKTKTTIDCKSKNEYRGYYQTYSVRCNSCHARGGTVGGYVKKNSYCKEDIVVYSPDELKSKAVKLWNTRI